MKSKVVSCIQLEWLGSNWIRLHELVGKSWWIGGLRRLRVNIVVLTNLPNIVTNLFTCLESINTLFDGLLLFWGLSFAFSFNIFNLFLIKALLFS